MALEKRELLSDRMARSGDDNELIRVVDEAQHGSQVRVAMTARRGQSGGVSVRLRPVTR